MNQALNDSDNVVRNNALVTSELDGDLVMLSIEKGKYYGLNGMGKEIWRRLETPISVEALCDDLSDKYEVKREQCHVQVLNFLQSMMDQDLVFRQHAQSGR